MGVRLFQHHLLKRLPFLHCVASAFLPSLILMEEISYFQGHCLTCALDSIPGQLFKGFTPTITHLSATTSLSLLDYSYWYNNLPWYYPSFIKTGFCPLLFSLHSKTPQRLMFSYCVYFLTSHSLFNLLIRLFSFTALQKQLFPKSVMTHIC